MFLYYRRAYPVTIDNYVVNNADCTRAWSRLPFSDFYQERLSPRDYRIRFLDYKLKEVNTIKEAFSEINLFCEINGLFTECVIRKQEADGLYVTYFNDQKFDGNNKIIRVHFVISSHEREQVGYDKTPEDRAGENDILPSKPDSYTNRYMLLKKTV